jgi:hypothetical protein
MTSYAVICALQTFRANAASVKELLRFDDYLLDFALGRLRQTHERQMEHKLSHRVRNDALIAALQNIRQHESLRKHYEVIYNQSLVLIVSHFSSAVRQLMIDGVTVAIDEGASQKVLDTEVVLSPRAVRESAGSLAQLMAEALADAKDVSFQDMQSIGRAFEKYFGAAPQRDATVNDIIAAQAARHAIVHAGGTASRRMVSQLRDAYPRTILLDLREGSIIHIAPVDVESVVAKMLAYLEGAAAIIEARGITLPREQMPNI